MKKVISVFVLCVVLTSSLLMSGCSGSYNSVIKNLEKIQNTRSLNGEEFFSLYTNGYGYDIIKKILKIFKDYYNEKNFSYIYKRNITDYGDDYKIKITEAGSSKMSSKDCEEIQAYLRHLGENVEEAVEKGKRYGVEQLAEAWQVSISDVHKVFDILNDLSELLKNAEVTEGRDVTLNYKITGEKTDGEISKTGKAEICKIDGVWIDINRFREAVDDYILDVLF